MDLSKIISTKLYLMRNSQNAAEVDAELDRRNQQAAKKVTHKPYRNSTKMVDYYRENNRWYIQDDGQIVKVEA